MRPGNWQFIESKEKQADFWQFILGQHLWKILQHQDPFKFLYIWLSNSTSENIYQGKILKYHINAPHAYD